MTTYNPVSPEFLAEVEAVIGKENVFTDPDKLDMYKTDEEYDPRRFRVPEAVVRPFISSFGSGTTETADSDT